MLKADSQASLQDVSPVRPVLALPSPVAEMSAPEQIELDRSHENVYRVVRSMIFAAKVSYLIYRC